MVTLAQQIEQLTSLGIFLVGSFLAVLSLVAYRREHDVRMAVLTVSYAMFSLYGFVVFLEYYVVDWGLLSAAAVELLEHGVAVLILFGLLGFFVAMSRS